MRSTYAILILALLGLVTVDAVAQRKPPGSEVGKLTPGGLGRRPKVVDKPVVPVDEDSIMVIRDIVYTTAQDNEGKAIYLKLDTAFPKVTNGKPLPVVVYIHGGGYKQGSKAAGFELIKLFAQGKYFAVSIDYRLSGVAPFPAAVHDCKAAIRFLRANAKDLAIDPNRIGIFGHSAGGHLCALLGVSSNNNVQTLEGNLQPTGESSAVRCVVDMSGPIDFLMVDEDARSRFLTPWLGANGETYDKNAKAASPLTYIDSEDPPILIIHGSDDQLVPVDHAIKFRDALKESGVKVRFFKIEDAGHNVVDPDTMTMISHYMDLHLRGVAGPVFEEKVRNARDGGKLLPGADPKEPPTTQPTKPVDPDG